MSDHNPDCLAKMAITGKCACPVPRLAQVLREAEARDKGYFAPRGRVQVCGEPDPNAWRADDPRWPGNHVDPLPLRARLTAILGDALVCPGCIRLRFSPIHLFNRVVGICDGRGW